MNHETWLPEVQEERPVMRPSTSTGSLCQNSDPRRKSCWEFESTTPMTTRPHFTFAKNTRLRRVRSRSLGAEIRADLDWSRLLVESQQESFQSSSVGLELDQAPNHQEHTKSIETSETSGDSDFTTTLEKQRPDDDDNSIGICILYGMINATIVLPVLMSFASIIYQHPAFSPYMPTLTKLAIISGIVHQVCFSTFSSLPFAVGQVQDAGLIFLSSMTTYMVSYCQSRGHDNETLLATATVSLALCTAILGLALILIGKWQLAQYVQMLPTCVVGGYLAYIGWFCGMSGVGLMAGSPSDLTVRHVMEQWQFVLPGIVGGIFIYATVRSLRHMAVLPTCILMLLAIFYLILWITDTSIEMATEQGWIRAMDPPPVWYRTWDYLRLDKVVWSVLPKLLFTELSMIFVVALSSSLDVAAIEIELKRPLNYNLELTTVGISNLVSGMTGGYTGSYIFSQTIFSLRAGIRSRGAGYALAGFQTIVLVLPFSLLSYVPNFFFGSLLVMICVDLLYEWLWDVKTRVTVAEYIINLTTFGMIQWLGVEYGIVAGVVIYVICQKVGMNVGGVKFATDATSSNNQCSQEQDGLVNGGSIQECQTNTGCVKVDYGSL